MIGDLNGSLGSRYFLSVVNGKNQSHHYVGQYVGPKPELYGRYIDTVSALPPLPERSLINS